MQWSHEFIKHFTIIGSFNIFKISYIKIIERSRSWLCLKNETAKIMLILTLQAHRKKTDYRHSSKSN